MNRHKIQPSEHQSIARRYATKGADTRESLAAEYGVSVRTIERILTAQGAKAPRKIHTLTEEQRRRAQVLLDDECPITEIAETLGCKESTLYKYGFRSRSRGNGFMYKHIAPLVKELGI